MLVRLQLKLFAFGANSLKRRRAAFGIIYHNRPDTPEGNTFGSRGEFRLKSNWPGTLSRLLTTTWHA